MEMKKMKENIEALRKRKVVSGLLNLPGCAYPDGSCLNIQYGHYLYSSFFFSRDENGVPFTADGAKKYVEIAVLKQKKNTPMENKVDWTVNEIIREYGNDK